MGEAYVPSKVSREVRLGAHQGNRRLCNNLDLLVSFFESGFQRDSREMQ